MTGVTEKLFMCEMLMCLTKTFARYRGYLGPLGPKWQKESENEFPGPVGPRAQKVQNGVENEPKSTVSQQFNYFDSFSTPFSTFGAAKARGPGNHFRIISNFGPEGPK